MDRLKAEKHAGKSNKIVRNYHMEFFLLLVSLIFFEEFTFH